MRKSDTTKKAIPSTLSRQEWLDYLDWKINNEKSTSTWSGISIWIILGMIELFASKAFQLIRIYGINNLLNNTVGYILVSICLACLLVIDAIRNNEKLRLQSIRNLKYGYSLYFIFGPTLFILVVDYFMNKSIDFGMLFIISIIIMITILTSKINQFRMIREILYSIPRLFRRFLKWHKSLYMRIQIRYGILLFISVLVLGIAFYKIKSNFSTYMPEYSTDLFIFSACFAGIIVGISIILILINVLYEIKMLVEYKDMYFLGKVDEEEISRFIISNYYGKDLNDKEIAKTHKKEIESCIKNISDIVERIEDIKAGKSKNGKDKDADLNIKLNNLNTKLMETYSTTLYKTHELYRHYISINDKNKCKEIADDLISLCEDMIKAKKMIKLNNKVLKQNIKKAA